MDSLKTSLNFFYVSELKNLCDKLSLSSKGKKRELISRIVLFVETGERSVNLKFPKVSCAKRAQGYELSENSLMLKSAYKNDLKTRMFFKKLIGDYFHFTAFGIDWLNDRWMEGNPPTYQEFSLMWKDEYRRRKANPASPKDEWAYIIFTKEYIKKYLGSSREDINASWEEERQKNKKHVERILKSFV